MQAFQLWLCVLLGLLCMTATSAERVQREDRDADSVNTQQKAEADVASYLSKTDNDAVARTEGEIHPFRVALKHTSENSDELTTPVILEKTEQAKDEEGAGGGAPVASKQNTPELMRYFERAQAQSKNAGRRKAEMKMRNGAMKRAARQESDDKKEETITPIPVAADASPAIAVEESAKKIDLPSHPHLLAFYLDLLASQANEQAEAADAMALLEQVGSTGPQFVTESTGDAGNTVTPPAVVESTGGAGDQPTVAATGGTASDTTTTTGATTAATGATAPATTGGETTSDTTSVTTETTAATGTGPTTTDTGADASTGDATTATDSSTGADDVTNSVVPLSHLEQLQKDLAAVEAEHAKRQAELNAELKKQQDQTRTLLEQERQGTVGLTVTPQLINPEKHLPIDPANAELYNNAPTDDKMSIKPSVFRKSNDLVAEATSQHAEFEHNMPLECAEPTCYVDQ